MPEYKLYYFNVRGYAETTRLCFAVGGIKYEDIRFTREEWQEKKKEGFSPSGHIPMLEVDGKKLVESGAIMKFAARLSGLSPSDSFDLARCDMVFDMTSDFLSKYIVPLYIEQDEEKKNKLLEDLRSTHIPKYMTHATNELKEGKGFFVGDKLTYADIMFFNFLDMLQIPGLQITGDHFSLFGDYPELKAHYERVGNVPAIKKWVETRPKTDH